MLTYFSRVFRRSETIFYLFPPTIHTKGRRIKGEGYLNENLRKEAKNNGVNCTLLSLKIQNHSK
jgi:hypothetical protein